MDETLNKSNPQPEPSFSPWRIDSKGLLVASVIGVVAGTFSFFVLDPLATVSHSIRLPGDVKKAIHLMELFGHGVGVLLVVWLLASLGERRWKQVAFAVTITSIAGALLKLIFIRQRPVAGEAAVPGIELSMLSKSDAMDVADPMAGLVRDSLHSFPSGHATTACALAVALALLYPRARAMFFTVAGLVCLQRVFVRAHYYSDVIVGATVGIVLCGLMMNLMEKRNRQEAIATGSVGQSIETGTFQEESLPGERRAA